MNKLNEQGTITVKTVKLDDLVESEIIKKPNLLKIDAEGAEATILSGGKTIISESHPTIFLATHGKLVHQKCCKFLKDLGYAAFPLNNSSVEEANELLFKYN